MNCCAPLLPRKVLRTIAGEADTLDGLLLSPKSFTATLLACCASDLERERLFRLLRGEGEWRRCVGEGGEGEGGSLAREHCCYYYSRMVHDTVFLKYSTILRR